MKRKLSLLVLVVLTISTLVACGKNKSLTKDSDNEVLKVAMDLKYPPFTGTDDKGNPEGMEVDIARALGEYMNKDVKIINTDFSMLTTSLETGEADVVISDMSVKEERKEKVDFSTPYMFGRTLALVNKEFAKKNNVTDNMTPEELFNINGIKVAGLAGTISVSVPQAYGVKVEEVTEIASGLMEINNGTADVLVGANTILGDHAAYPDTTIVYSGIKDYSSSAMAVKKGNSELLEQVNKFIESMYKDEGFYVKAGTKYDKGIGEYLKDDSKGLDYIIYPPAGSKE